MKFIVLNGSPKGPVSVTMQYIHFLEKRFPEHDFEILHIAQRIRKIENDKNTFGEICNKVSNTDAVVWAFPLYVYLVHAHYKRFIELIFEKGATDVFANKYAVIFSTSIKFYDITAHSYIHAVCDDLKMNVVGAYTADMPDLTKVKERKRFTHFAEHTFQVIQEKQPVQPQFSPLKRRDFTYKPGEVAKLVSSQGKRILLLSDARTVDTGLNGMIQRFQASFIEDIRTINLHDLSIKGSCQGCLRCGYNFECFYDGKDDYRQFWEEELETSDIIVIAGTIRDRYLSSLWKCFFDRRFFHTHTPRLIGKQIIYLISGPLSHIPNLRMILEAYIELEMANIVGFVTDEFGDSRDIDLWITRHAADAVRFSVEKYIKPETFLGVAARKLFRDEIYGRLRMVFQADYREYKKLGLFDFPQKKIGLRMLNAITGILFRIPAVRKKFQGYLKGGMIMPHQRVLKKLYPEE
jgi:multimeric flavodoxin WrbA